MYSSYPEIGSDCGALWSRFCVDKEASPPAGTDPVTPLRSASSQMLTRDGLRALVLFMNRQLLRKGVRIDWVSIAEHVVQRLKLTTE